QVQVRGGATSGVDYVAAENELVTIPAGQTSWEIPITIIGDDSRESSENFFVIGDLTIESDAFAILVKDKATVVITNDDRSGCSDGFNHRHSGHDDNHNGRDDGHED
ncbi:MAG: Calx-beta domain-containing protein, partial [Patescibacteria group bacterium]